MQGRSNRSRGLKLKKSEALKNTRLIKINKKMLNYYYTNVEGELQSNLGRIAKQPCLLYEWLQEPWYCMGL
jgi:hypothetical protein